MTQDTWIRWLPIWHTVFFALLVLICGLSLSLGVIHQPIVFFGLNSVLVIWYSITIKYPSTQWEPYPLRLLLYMLLGWTIWSALALITTDYLLLLCILFPHLFIYMAFRWAIVGTVILNALILVVLYHWNPTWVPTWLLISLITSVIGVILGYFINDMINQSQERKRLVLELQTTQQQLKQAERLRGISEERHRLAGELHDTLVQSLIGIATHLEAIENAIHQQSDFEDYLHIAKQTARDTLTEARQIIWGLQPLILESLPVWEALRLTCEQWSAITNIPTHWLLAGNPQPVPLDSQHTLLRALQESLANITKHSQATQVLVTLKYSDERVRLIISDDGHGFDTTQARLTGQGLKLMRYRVEHLQGTLSIESQPTTGTTITIQLPIKE